MEISLREKAEKTKRKCAFRKKESLTDKAPAFGDDVSELRVAREGEREREREREREENHSRYAESERMLKHMFRCLQKISLEIHFIYLTTN